MSTEDVKILEICPVCGGELRFIHISFEEDVKMCTNEDCVYPFVPGVIDEFVPTKIKTEEDLCSSDEYKAILKRKIERKFQEKDLDWDKFDGNECVSNVDLKGTGEWNHLLDELTLKKEVDVGDTNGLNVDEFLDSLCSTKSSASATAYEDPNITEMIQSCIDGTKAEVNNDTYEDSIKSVMNELEETLEKMNVKSQINVQWNADDFNTDTFETNKSSDLETAAAVEQASPQCNYDPNRPNITAFSDAPSGLGVTATIGETSRHTICASKKSNDNPKRYADQLKHLFAQNSFPKFVFPEFVKSTQVPEIYSEPAKNEGKINPKIDNTDYNIKQMPKRRSKRLKSNIIL